MQAIRQYATVHGNTLILHLPDEMNETEVEVIVMPSDKENKNTSKNGLNIEAIRKKITHKMTNDEIDAQLKEMREEWERPLF
jgi:predicted RNA-binding protein YlqC (UPF0109 family)